MCYTEIFLAKPHGLCYSSVPYLGSVLGIKGVHYIGSVQPPLDIWKNNKKAENCPNSCSYRIAGEYANMLWRIAQKNSTR
jgi:hypothetical protein